MGVRVGSGASGGKQTRTSMKRDPQFAPLPRNIVHFQRQRLPLYYHTRGLRSIIPTLTLSVSIASAPRQAKQLFPFSFRSVSNRVYKRAPMRTDDDNAEDAVCEIAGRNNTHGAKLKHAKTPKVAEIVRETAITGRKYHRSFLFNTVSMPSEKPIVAPPMDIYVGIRDPQFAALPRNFVHFQRQRLYIGPWLHPSLRRFPQRRL